MLARCARCHQTFATETFGVQKCPHCGAEIHLADPSAPQAPPPAPPPAGPPGWGAAPPPPVGWGPLPPSPPPPPSPGWAPLPPGMGQPPAGEQSAPFAERARLGFFHAFAETLKLAALEPARFFRQVRLGQSGSAVLFGVVAFTVGRLVESVFGYLTSAATAGYMQQVLSRLPHGERSIPPQLLELGQITSLGALLVNAVASPLLGLVLVYLSAGIFHLLLSLFRGAPRGFEGTLTVVGYASGIYILHVVPGCGGLVAWIWFAVLAITGLAEAHRVPHWKAGLAVLLPVVLLFLCGCFAALAVGAAMFGAAQGGAATSL
jgi:hypothetical protein